MPLAADRCGEHTERGGTALLLGARKAPPMQPHHDCLALSWQPLQMTPAALEELKQAPLALWLCVAPWALDLADQVMKERVCSFGGG